ncbi:MAG: response regulator [Gemmatimonadaceae bacterium]|nr:response regulator [Gemmatimonadaceae bacterium]
MTRHQAASRSKARVLVVDDDAEVRTVLVRAMQTLGHAVSEAADGTTALAVAQGHDLILMDVQMPGMSGFDVVARIRKTESGASLPILMITGQAGHAERLRALRAGANDFIGKPFDFAELRLRCGWLLTLKQAHDAIARHNAELEQAVRERTVDLERALDGERRGAAALQEAHLDTIRRLVTATEFRDSDTAAHIRRIGALAEQLALADGWRPGEARDLYHAAQMHDVGKVGVPDAILLKRGPLDLDERRAMEQHTIIGHRILRDSPSSLLQLGAVIALAHHERWDGTGYPQRLTGPSIPRPARITAIVDFFDALTSDRPYRSARPVAETVDVMRDERGRHFDPDLLDHFLVFVERSMPWAPAGVDHPDSETPPDAAGGPG